MKLAVSVAIVVLLLGMPLGCILNSHLTKAAHPCCPMASTNLKCPYDLLDSAKATGFHHAVVPQVIGLVAPATVIAPVEPSVQNDGIELPSFSQVLRI